MSKSRPQDNYWTVMNVVDRVAELIRYQYGANEQRTIDALIDYLRHIRDSIDSRIQRLNTNEEMVIEIKRRQRELNELSEFIAKEVARERTS